LTILAKFSEESCDIRRAVLSMIMMRRTDESGELGMTFGREETATDPFVHNQYYMD
jgi:hypothetical protein